MMHLVKTISFSLLLVFSMCGLSQAETKSNLVVSDDSKWKATIDNAKKSLPHFRSLLMNEDIKGSVAMVKVYFSGQGIYLWFMVATIKSESFTVTAFETFPDLPQIKVGEFYSVTDSQVVDWSLNHGGEMYGGYSMRYHRSRISAIEKEKYDNYVGVTTWMSLVH